MDDRFCLHGAASRADDPTMAKLMVQRLIDNGADMPADINELQDGFALLHIAVLKSNPFAVQLLLELGADVSIRGSGGLTPLHCASLRKVAEAYDIYKLLLERGANVNDRADHDITPFHFALANRSFEIVQLLLEYGADIGAVDAMGQTAVHFAAKNSHAGVIEFVLGQRCETEYTCGNNNNNWPVLDCSADCRKPKTFQSFLQRDGLGGVDNQDPLTVVESEYQEAQAVLLERESNIVGDLGERSVSEIIASMRRL